MLAKYQNSLKKSLLLRSHDLLIAEKITQEEDSFKDKTDYIVNLHILHTFKTLFIKLFSYLYRRPSQTQTRYKVSRLYYLIWSNFVQIK